MIQPKIKTIIVAFFLYSHLRYKYTIEKMEIAVILLQKAALITPTYFLYSSDQKAAFDHCVIYATSSPNIREGSISPYVICLCSSGDLGMSMTGYFSDHRKMSVLCKAAQFGMFCKKGLYLNKWILLWCRST